MAKIVIAGYEGCPAFARVELLADTLAARLPHFNVDKVVKSSEEWSSWLAAECDAHSWSHSGNSPLVWRELVDTGGKGLYLGGLKEFEDYSQQYYAIVPSTTPELEDLIAAENKETYRKKQRKLEEAVPEVLVRVCVTNASSCMAYQLAQLVATGTLLGSARVALHLYHQDEDGAACESIAMELQDLASPQLAYVRTTSSLRDALDGVDLVFVLDWTYSAANLNLCSSDSDEWAEVMGGVGTLYHNYAQAVEAWASDKVKVCVTGCVANLGVAVMAASVPALAGSCMAAPCLAESQARTVLGQHLNIHSSNISQVTIWGRTHGQVLPDHTFTRVRHFPGAVVGPDPFDLPLSRCEFDKEWLKEDFPRLVALRHQQLENYREDGPAMAEAVALAGLARKWLLPEEWEEEKEEEEEENMGEENTEEEEENTEEEEKMEEDKEEVQKEVVVEEEGGGGETERKLEGKEEEREVEKEAGEEDEEKEGGENGGEKEEEEEEEEEEECEEEDVDWEFEGHRAWSSVGVVSNGDTCYKVPKGLVVSLPCRCREGKWQPVPGLQLKQHIKDGLAHQLIQLQHELDVAMTALKTRPATS